MSHNNRKLLLGAMAAALFISPLADAAVLPAMPPSVHINAGPLGELSVGGILSVNGRAQSNRYDQPGPAGKYFSADVTDGLVSVAKTHGLIQFYLEAGAYNFYVVGQPASSTVDTTKATFGALPLGYIQITPNKNFNVQIGKLPAITGITPLTGLISDSYNVQFGLDGDQQQTITRGIQVNYSTGPFSASAAWTDGYYSNRYNWAVGQLSYSPTSSSTFTFQAAGNMGKSHSYDSNSTLGDPNNSDFYLLGYNYSGSKLNLFSYLEYFKLFSANPASTNEGDMYGASIDGNYAFTKNFSLSTRLDYMAYSDSQRLFTNLGPDNTALGYGPGSRAFSLTLTPIYQVHHWFIEGDLSYVHAYHISEGDGFGQNGTAPNQFVAMLNTGFLL